MNPDTEQNPGLTPEEAEAALNIREAGTTLRELREENERLREALKEAMPNCERHPSGHCITCSTRRPCRGDILREALNPAGDGKGEG